MTSLTFDAHCGVKCRHWDRIRTGSVTPTSRAKRLEPDTTKFLSRQQIDDKIGRGVEANLKES